MILAERFKELPVPWPRGQDLPRSCFRLPVAADLAVAISHGWPFQAHPDPFGTKAAVIQRLVQDTKQMHQPSGETVLFVDFLSMSQRPFLEGQAERTESERDAFAMALECMHSVYLSVDAVLHLETDWCDIPGDGEEVHLDLRDLVGVALLQLGPDVQVVGHGFPTVRLFDLLVTCDGQPVPGNLSAQDVIRMCDVAVKSARRYPVTLRRAPMGKQNRIPPGERGWVFCERFLTMVKVAMSEETNFDKICVSNCEEIKNQIREGSRQLRHAAQVSEERLWIVFGRFWGALGKKRFSAASTDGVLLDGKRDREHQDDRQIVTAIMQQVTMSLTKHWMVEAQRQGQRQLLLAVNRGDLDGTKELLEAAADPNHLGESRESLLHLAVPRRRDKEVVRVLVQHKGDLTVQDKQGNCPAHLLPLAPTQETVELFEMLTTREVLGLVNVAGCTVARRFAAWSKTAENNEPYPPAMTLIEKLSLEAPDAFKKRQTVVTRHRLASAAVERGSCVVRSVQDNDMQDNGEFHVPTWETKGCPVTHLVYLTGQCALPWEMQETAVDTIARDWCSRHRLKVFAVTHLSCPVASDMSLEGYQEGVLSVLSGLPLNYQFVLVINMSMMAGIISHLQDRLAGVAILNLGCFYTPEFLYCSDWEQHKARVLRMKEWFRQRDVEKVHGTFSQYVFGEISDCELAQLKAQHKNLLMKCRAEFWAFGAATLSWMLEHTTLVSALNTLPRIPAVTICSDSAQFGDTHESTERFRRKFIPWAPMRFVPDSNMWWEIEGDTQREHVGSYLDELICMMRDSQAD